MKEIEAAVGLVMMQYTENSVKYSKIVEISKKISDFNNNEIMQFNHSGKVLQIPKYNAKIRGENQGVKHFQKSIRRQIRGTHFDMSKSQRRNVNNLLNNCRLILKEFLHEKKEEATN